MLFALGDGNHTALPVAVVCGGPNVGGTDVEVDFAEAQHWLARATLNTTQTLTAVQLRTDSDTCEGGEA